MRSAPALTLLALCCAAPISRSQSGIDPAAAELLIELRSRSFDPLQAGGADGGDGAATRAAQAIDAATPASDGPGLWIVQRLEDASAELVAAALARSGFETLAAVPRRASLVRGDSADIETARRIAGVRWIGPYRAADRLGPELASRLGREAEALDVFVLTSGSYEKHALLDELASAGARILDPRGSSALFAARVDARDLARLAADPRVLWLERHSRAEVDLEHAREQSGAVALELHRGFRGAGLRAEVYEGIDALHPAFAAGATRTLPLLHGCGGSSTHGTAIFGILFGNGAGNPRARGFCPDAQGLWNDPSCDGRARVDRLRELVDPALPYRAVLQTASWGHARTRFYTAISAELDAALFENDLVVAQSQSNSGSRESRPEAWAKNVLAVGGVYHGENASPDDDHWSGGASIGPAEDGRWKPDFVGYYDGIETTVPGGYTGSFGGSSGATPMVAGAAILAQQMFAEGAFDAPSRAVAGEPFARRASASTVKALLLASARPYPFRGASDDLARVHQGWGFPDLRALDAGASGALVVDARTPLRERASASYDVWVEPGAPALRVALAWREPAALPSVRSQLVNDLDLELQGPAGSLWRGNAFLADGPSSRPGGSADRTNPAEAVFVEHPAPGLWRITVRAHRVELDALRATPAWDVPFALVALGGWDQAARLEREGMPCALRAGARPTGLVLAGAPRAGGVLRLELAPAPPPGARAFLCVAPASERWGPYALPLDLAASGAPGCALGVALEAFVEWPAPFAAANLALPNEVRLLASEWSAQAFLVEGANSAWTETWRIRCAP